MKGRNPLAIRGTRGRFIRIGIAAVNRPVKGRTRTTRYVTETTPKLPTGVDLVHPENRQNVGLVSIE